MKRLLSLSLFLMMALLSFAHSFEVDGIYYNITSSTKLTVAVTYKGISWNHYSNEYTGDVTIPATVIYSGKTYSVTSIGKEAFYNCSGLTSITIPSSVTSIGYNAFDGTAWYDNQPNGLVYAGKVAYTYKGTMPNDTKIVLKEGTIGIAERAFYNCSGLTSIKIPNSVTSIGDEAFWNCRGLTSVAIPNSVTSIGDRTFYNCSGLTSVTIGNGVTTIGNSAFYYCSGLTSITIPNSVTSIGSSAFYGCSDLTSVTIGNGVTTIGDCAFFECSGLTSITIPNSVTSIGYDAFLGCSSLTSVDIPNSVKFIGLEAFSDCSGLTSVTIGNSVTAIGGFAFSGCSGLTSIVVEKDNTKYDSRDNCNAIIETASNTLILGCKTTVIPNSVTTIGEEAFYGCSSLTSVTIPNSVTSIGNCAFYYCSGLTSVTIPNSVTSIGDYAFYGCIGLTSVTIPNSVTSIGNSAFYECRSLTSVAIPNSVTSIGNYAFEYCSGLKEITSYIQEPFQIGDYCWDGVDKSIPLYVPAETKEKYQSIGGWKDFTNIIEEPTDPTGINSVDNSQSATDNEAGDWYTIDGRKLSGKPAQKGIYIVNGRKVAVK